METPEYENHKIMIFWDIDNTLIDYQASERTAILHVLQQEGIRADEEKALKFWRDISQRYFNDFLCKKISFEEQGGFRILELFRLFRRNLSMEQAIHIFYQYKEILENSWTLFEDVLPCLKQLKEMRMGIISNGQKQQQKQKLKAAGIEQFFEVQCYAEDFGIKKPDADMFLTAVKMSHAKREEIWYIGDDLENDIYPCMELGIPCIWVNREGKSADKDINMIRSLSQVEPYIRRERSK